MTFDLATNYFCNSSSSKLEFLILPGIPCLFVPLAVFHTLLLALIFACENSASFQQLRCSFLSEAFLVSPK